MAEAKLSPDANSASVVVGAVSDQGQVRTNNEDRYAIFLPPALPHGLDAVLVVADGMGGYQGGEIASGMVVDQFTRWLRERGTRKLGRGGDWQVALERIIHDASAAISGAASATAGLEGMGTTVVAAALARGRLHLANVGDSRAYLVSKTDVRQLTRDHSWVSDAVREGVLTPDEARHHPRRNLLTRVVGRQPDVEVDLRVYDVCAGDYLVMCTDGLSNLVSEAELGDIVRTSPDPAAGATTLVELAKKRGAPDNVTVVIARLSAVTDRTRGPANRRLLAAVCGLLVALAAIVWFLIVSKASSS